MQQLNIELKFAMARLTSICDGSTFHDLTLFCFSCITFIINIRSLLLSKALIFFVNHYLRDEQRFARASIAIESIVLILIDKVHSRREYFSNGCSIVKYILLYPGKRTFRQNGSWFKYIYKSLKTPENVLQVHEERQL